jgi:ribosome biogenesis SPOUT family RNA methylase Rps3
VLGTLKMAVVTDFLLSLLEDGSHWLCLEAMEALKQLGDFEAAAALEDWLSGADEELAAVARDVVEALKNSRDGVAQ